ncbi:MAG: YihY family inner membrane protein [bacterium]|nr:MAG: YihY family inner membrane protein [bacterium]
MTHLSEIVLFLREGIWRVREKDHSGFQLVGLRVLRIVVLSLRGFVEDRCQLRAASLTFYSLLSVVPVAALAFGIAKGFGFQKALEARLYEKLEFHGEVVGQVMGFANSLLENTRGGLVAGAGVLILMWAALKVLTNIENAFNDIWGVVEGRPFIRKVTDYLSLMLILPTLFVSSSAVTVLVAGRVEALFTRVHLLGPLSPVVFAALRFLPLVAIWVLFAFAYIFMPNTKVSLSAGLLAGVVAGTFYQVFQIGYLKLQIGVAKYNAIYGSFAALPLFLIWLQVSWMIVLSGAELSFAQQNASTYEFEPDSDRVSPAFLRLLALRVVNLIAKHFTPGEPPLSEESISQELEIPIRLLREILFELTEAGVITATAGKGERTAAFRPAFTTDEMTIHRVLEALDHRGLDGIPVAHSEELETLSDSLATFAREMETSSSNRLLRDI